jgi:hypothetical protein
MAKPENKETAKETMLAYIADLGRGSSLQGESYESNDMGNGLGTHPQAVSPDIPQQS